MSDKSLISDGVALLLQKRLFLPGCMYVLPGCMYECQSACHKPV